MDLSNWMTDLEESLISSPLINLAIPGSHDSLSYTIKNNSRISPDADPAIKLVSKFFGPLVRKLMYNWCVTQKLTVTEQLEAGIRYFDLRLATKNGDKSFYFVHGMYGGSIEKPLKEIVNFINSKQGEIAIVDFQHFYDFTSEDHNRLALQLLNIFEGLLCPIPSNLRTLSLRKMINKGHKVIVVYRNGSIHDKRLWKSSYLETPWPNTMSPIYLVEFLSKGLYNRSSGSAYVSQCVLTPSRYTVVASPCDSVYTKCAVPAAEATIPWLSRLQCPSSLNIAIADFVQDNDAAFSKAVIAVNKL